MGGNNHFQYAPSPVEWIDPWGLSLIRPRPNKLSPVSGSRESAISGAWGLEQDLLNKSNGTVGTRNWSQKDIELIRNTPRSELTSVMSRAGYTGHHINSVKGNGALGESWKGDPRNIVFLENHNHPNSTRGDKSTVLNLIMNMFILIKVTEEILKIRLVDD